MTSFKQNAPYHLAVVHGNTLIVHLSTQQLLQLVPNYCWAVRHHYSRTIVRKDSVTSMMAGIIRYWDVLLHNVYSTHIDCSSRLWPQNNIWKCAHISQTLLKLIPAAFTLHMVRLPAAGCLLPASKYTCMRTARYIHMSADPIAYSDDLDAWHLPWRTIYSGLGRSVECTATT